MNLKKTTSYLTHGNPSRAKQDAWILLVIFLLTSLTSVHFNLFEHIEQWVEQYDHYQLDEIIIVSSFSSIFAAIFALRRWFELIGILRSRNEDEQILKNTNAQLKQKTEELEKHRKRSDKLSQLANFLQVCKSREEAFRFISNAASGLFVGCHGAIFVARDSRNQLSLVSQWGDKQHPEFFSPDDCWGLRLGKQFVSNPGWDTPLCAHTSTDGLDTRVCIPLTAYGEIIGLFHIQIPDNEGTNAGSAQPITPLLNQSLTIFTEQISLSLSNLTLQGKLKDLAIHDQLTGLYNRQYLRETFDRELNRANRNNSKLGIIMLDVDHFKKFNDTFGHPAGDMILRELGGFLKKYFRVEDFCCRFGGEEFLILLPDITSHGFKERCDTLRKGISEINITIQDVPIDKITASIGAAIFPENGENFSQLVEAADKALYRAKAEGRNRVCFPEPAA